MTTTPINIEIDGESILPSEFESCTIQGASGVFSRSISISFSGPRLYSLCNPLTNKGQVRVKVSIGSSAHWFLIERREAESEFGRAGFSVWGRSKQAILAAPFAERIRDEEGGSHPWQTGNVLFSAVIDYVAENYSEYDGTITLNAPDFMIYAGSLTVSDVTPAEIISELVDAAGYELQAGTDGSLSIDLFETAAGEPVRDFFDLDEVVSIGENILGPSGYNAVTVSGGQDDAAADTAFISAERIEAEAAAEPDVEYGCLGAYKAAKGTFSPDQTIYTGEKFKVRVYFYHKSLTPTYFAPGVDYIAPAGSGVEETTEIVDLVWGVGNTRRPNLVGETLVEGDDTVPLERREVTYSTRYQDYEITENDASDPNDLEDPGRSIMFYFSDKSAYSVFNFQAFDEEDVVGSDEWDVSRSRVVEVDEQGARPICFDESALGRSPINQLLSERGPLATISVGSRSNAPRIETAGKGTDGGPTQARADTVIGAAVLAAQHPVKSRGRWVYFRTYPSLAATKAYSVLGAVSIFREGFSRIFNSTYSPDEPYEEVLFVDGVAWLRYPARVYYPSNEPRPRVSFPISGSFAVQSQNGSARLLCPAFVGVPKYANVPAKVRYETSYDLWRFEVPASYDATRLVVSFCFAGVDMPTTVDVSLREVESKLDVLKDGENVRTPYDDGGVAGLGGLPGSVREIEFVGEAFEVTDLGDGRIQVGISDEWEPGGGGGAWVSVLGSGPPFDNDTWGATNGYWDGEKFVRSGPGPSLQKMYSHPGFGSEYTKMRVTGTVDAAEYPIEVGSGLYGSNYLGGLDPPQSCAEFGLDWSGAGEGAVITNMILYAFAEITDIELYWEG